MSRFLSIAAVMTAMAAAAQTSTPVATGPGNQTDPHISGNYVAYTNDSSGSTRISYSNVLGGASTTIPANTGDSDTLSDISATTIVFVRSNDNGSNIYRYNVGDSSASAIDFQAEGARTNAAVGGSTVAFEELGNVKVYDLGTSSFLATFSGSDPAVSANGAAVAYVSGGAVWQATASSGWTGSVVSSGASDPDTSGSTVVYVKGGDIAWTNGSGETVYTFAGTDSNPNVSGSLVAFEHESGGQTDLYLIDTAAASPTAIQLTNTPGVSETLNDVNTEGATVHVVYAMRSAAGDFDVHVVTYTQAPSACDWPSASDAQAACDALWDSETAAAELSVERGSSKPTSTSVTSTWTGEGFICVRSHASSGNVEVNNVQFVSPGALNGTDQKFSQAGTLESGWTLSATVGGSNGSSIDVKVFAKNQVCPVISPAPGTTSDPLVSDEGGVSMGGGKDKNAGCSASGGTNAVWVAGLLALLVMFRPQRASVRRSRR